MKLGISLRVFILSILLVSLQTGGALHAQNLPGTEFSPPLLETFEPLGDIVLPRLYPIIASDVSPTLGDATLINRLRFIVALAMADAAAPYHPTAVGMYTRIPRVPELERTDRNINTAMLHAAYQALSGLLPDRQPVWREMLTDYGLNPDDASTDLDSPVGIGNVAGKAAHDGRLRDGMNQTGNYQDTTGYAPVNSAFELRDPSRWQRVSVLWGRAFIPSSSLLPRSLPIPSPLRPLTPAKCGSRRRPQVIRRIGRLTPSRLMRC